MIHRDVKPSNILVGEGRWAMLTDFGLAKILGGGQHLTKSGVGMGTPDYMSPEQAQGLPSDSRSDLYSPGVTLYEMVTGRVPFEADSSMGVVVKLTDGATVGWGVQDYVRPYGIKNTP